MQYLTKMFFTLALVASCASTNAYSSNLEKLFKDKWSEKCANSFGVETSEYMTFNEAEQCTSYVDTFRVQSNCTPAKFKNLGGNRVQMTVNDNDTYIIEFLWSSQISIMEVVKEKPFELKQIESLGRAIVRKNLLTHHLYCP